MIPLLESRQTNIHVNDNTERDAYIAMRTGRDAHLGLPKLILPALQVNICAGEAPVADDNGVPYLRMPFNRSIPQILKGG